MCRYSKFRRSINETLRQQFSYVDDSEDQPGTSTENQVDDIKLESPASTQDSRQDSEIEEIVSFLIDFCP